MKELIIRAYGSADASAASAIWNEVVADGTAFPQTELFTAESGDAFFRAQTYAAVACDAQLNTAVGLYILHPNNVGRCGHIANASYAVSSAARGRHVGAALVNDCKRTAKQFGFRILQFNAVVATNAPALHLYEKLGFVRLGVIPGGFHMPDDSYEDIIPHYCIL